MKRIVTIIIIAAVAAAIIFGVYSYKKCKSCGPQTKAHVYLIDTSDSLLINYPDPIDIADNFFNAKDNIFNGASFKLRTVAANNYAQGHELYLTETTALLSNEIQRIDEMNQFFRDITTSVELILNQSNGARYSSILRPLVQELTAIQAAEADEKKIFLYSDLKENTSEGLNMYDKKTLGALHIEPDKIRAQIEEYIEFPKDLEGIELHLLYSSGSYIDIKTFEAMAEIIQYLIEDKSGATVVIHSHHKTED